MYPTRVVEFAAAIPHHHSRLEMFDTVLAVKLLSPGNTLRELCKQPVGHLSGQEIMENPHSTTGSMPSVEEDNDGDQPTVVNTESVHCRTEFLCVDNICTLARSELFAI